jgi:hypothetical protein
MTTADVVDDAAVVEQSRRDPELFATIYTPPPPSKNHPPFSKPIGIIEHRPK